MAHKIHCCETCHLYWTCELKWYRGEKGEENLCCPLCHYFMTCSDKTGCAPKKPAAKAK